MAAASETHLTLQSRLAGVRLLLLDVDGVLTTGGITWTHDGSEQKTFNIRDGLSIKLWQQAGGLVGIITGRSSAVVQIRARELSIDTVRQGVVDKLQAASEILAEQKISWEQTAFIGDDLPDLSIVQRCGLGVAVADACSELLAAARLVTRLPGGRGAVREVIEQMLSARGSWQPIVGRYSAV